MKKVIDFDPNRVTNIHGLKTTIHFKGKDTCLDDLIQVVGTLDRYIFTIHTISGNTVQCNYIQEVNICYDRRAAGVMVELWVRSKGDMYNVKKIEIERDK